MIFFVLFSHNLHVSQFIFYKLMSGPPSGNASSILLNGQRVVFKGLDATVRFVGEVGVCYYFLSHF